MPEIGEDSESFSQYELHRFFGIVRRSPRRDMQVADLEFFAGAPRKSSARAVPAVMYAGMFAAARDFSAPM